MPDFSCEDQCDGLICGVDEVGRGPLAGPVVAAAVIIPRELRTLDFVHELRDSKELTFAKREKLYLDITQNFPYQIAEISPEEIDDINILQASLKAMKTACERIGHIDHALIDGNKAPDLSCRMRTVIKGDTISYSIAAASIIAKVHRDRIMRKLHEEYICYGWNRNVGYSTKQHCEALLTHGITPYHRKTFAPVRKLLAL